MLDKDTSFPVLNDTILDVRDTTNPADQNPVIFKNTTGLKSLALKFTSTYPAGSRFIPNFSNAKGMGYAVTNNNTITNNSPTKGWDHSAIYSQTTSLTEGQVCLNMGQTNLRIMFGLATAYSGAMYATLSYAIFAGADGTLQVYEGQANVFTKGFGNYTVNDVLAVERRGDTIAYLKNSVVFYVSRLPSTATMHFCAVFEEPGASINNVYQRNFMPTGSTSGYMTKGFVGAGYKIENNNTLVGTADGWDASYVYSQGTSQSGKVSIRVNQTDKSMIFGVSPPPPPGANPPPMDHADIGAIIFKADGTYTFFLFKGTVENPSYKYTTNDIFSVIKIEAADGSIRFSFLQNDRPFATNVLKSPVQATGYYFSFNQKDAAMADVLWSDIKPSKNFFDIQNINGVSLNAATKEISYNSIVVATINRDGMPEFPALPNYCIINNNTMVSQTEEEYDFITTTSFSNAGISYRVGQTNITMQVKFNIAGKPPFPPYCGIQTDEAGNLNIVTADKLWNVGKYTTDDVLSITANAGIITCSRNGTVLYTMKSTEKLVLDIYSKHLFGSITDIKMRIFDDIDDTDGLYIMFNNKASVLAIDNIAAAVSSLVPDPDSKVEISYTPELIFSIPN